MDDTACRLIRLAELTAASYERKDLAHMIRERRLPSRARTIEITKALLALTYPGFFEGYSQYATNSTQDIHRELDTLCQRLTDKVSRCLQFSAACEGSPSGSPVTDKGAKEIAVDFLECLPALRLAVVEDVRAAYEGDPAAGSLDEVVLAYPGVFAVTVYRLAHELLNRGVPLMPRIMSEWVHSKTGIDINPGAVIGRRFFIDHGTGVVIGQTAVIGNNVKIYQGVTLGALSFPKDEHGRVVRGHKRHPSVGDNVTIYANATVLGGDTKIGDNSVIGGSVFLTGSVTPTCIVNIESPRLSVRTRSFSAIAVDRQGDSVSQDPREPERDRRHVGDDQQRDAHGAIERP
jgi:serine O-acetyltransferase